MQIAKNKIKLSTKNCAACSLPFRGSQFQKYCSTKNCIDLRKESAPKRIQLIDPDADNRIVSKALVGRVISMNHKVVSLRCKAPDDCGKLCGKAFNVFLDKRRVVYPKYCEKHRNAYQRTRYKLSRS